MNFTPVDHNEKTIGYAAINNNFIYFFGTAKSSLETLKEHFDTLTFFKLKQEHGDRLVAASVTVNVADAHWSNQCLHAPTIATADCIPILISHDEFVCAIHAGWRGVENEILIKSVRKLLNNHSDPSSLTVTIGPHIQPSSFVVDSPLAVKFQEQYKRLGGTESISVEKPSAPGKALVNLKKIVLQQLLSCGIDYEQVFEFEADTKTDSRFSSYRREKELTGRNISFVSRLKK